MTSDEFTAMCEAPQDGEEWRPVETNLNYAVSSLGRVMRVVGGVRCRAGKVLKPNTKRGYEVVVLSLDGSVKQASIHRLVCWAFHGAPPSGLHQAAHENHIPNDNRPSNLRWALPNENIGDKVAANRQHRPQGQIHGMAKLTEADVVAIRAMRGVSHETIAAQFGVRRQAISRIISGERWPHLS